MQAAHAVMLRVAVVDAHKAQVRAAGAAIPGVPAKSTQRLRIGTTSISTRRFFARPSALRLSATGCVLPLPSV